LLGHWLSRCKREWFPDPFSSGSGRRKGEA